LWVHAQTNQPWVTVEPPSVPSDFTNFTLRLHYLRDPGPGEAWAARLTLIPQWGDRQILAITIERRPAWLGLAIVVCGAIAFLSFLAAYLLGR
jgi:hypothetical protein